MRDCSEVAALPKRRERVSLLWARVAVCRSRHEMHTVNS